MTFKSFCSDPDPTIKKKWDPDPNLKKKPDPTYQNYGFIFLLSPELMILVKQQIFEICLLYYQLWLIDIFLKKV